jgi:hypothetical protein
MYVIGLQECLYLAEARALLRRHLETGGSSDNSGGSQFYMFNREIGSTNTSLGYHVRWSDTPPATLEGRETDAYLY